MAVVVLHHPEGAFGGLELPQAPQLFTGRAAVAVQENDITDLSQRVRIGHAPAARRSNRQGVVGMVEALSNQFHEAVDIVRYETGMIPTAAVEIPLVRYVDDDVAKVLLDEPVRDVLCCDCDSVGRFEDLVLPGMKIDKADDHAALVGRREQPLEAAEPFRFERPVRAEGANERALLVAALRRPVARNAFDLVVVARIVALQANADRQDTMLFVEVESVDDLLGVAVWVKSPRLEPLIIEQRLRQPQQHELAAGLAAVSRVRVGELPGRASGSAHIKTVGLVPRPQHRPRRDFDRRSRNSKQANES